MPSLLSGLLGGPRSEDKQPRPGPYDDFWYEVSRQTATGLRLGIREAMTVPAFRRCVAVLAGSIASLPLLIYRRTDQGKERAPEHPLYPILHDAANYWQSSYDFRQTLAANLVVYNRAYARIVLARNGTVERLEPMRSDRVTAKPIDGGRIVFDVRQSNGTTQRLTQDEVFFVNGLGFGELNPPSLLDDAQDTIALGLALTRYVAKSFRNGVRLAGVLEHPNKLTPEARDNLKQTWHEQYAGVDNAGKTAVLEEGMKFKELAQKNADAQLFELWNFNIEELARVFGVPAVLVGHADKTSTYASAEQFFLSFVSHSLRPWLVCIEQAFNLQLVYPNDRFFAEFNVDGLLRGDAKARADFYQKGITTGWLSRNEARALENLNARPGADELLQPLNMTPAASMDERQDSSSDRPPGALLLDHRGRWLPRSR